MIVEVSLAVAAAVLLAYVLVCALRLALGPTPADRAVALDTINTLMVAIMILLGAALDLMIIMDVALVYALLSFVGTLYIARYLEEGLR